MKIIKTIKNAKDFIRVLQMDMKLDYYPTFTDKGLSAIFDRITEEQQYFKDGSYRKDYELSVEHLKEYFGEGSYQEVLDKFGANTYEKLADYVNWSEILKDGNSKNDRIVYHIRAVGK